jgi:hypothetical protein
MAALADVKTRTDSAIHEDVVYELKWDAKISSNDIAVAVGDALRLRFQLHGERCRGEGSQAGVWSARGGEQYLSESVIDANRP